MSRHDAYYEPDDYDDRYDEIEELAYQMTKPGGEYDCHTAQAVYEAMGDLDTPQAESLQAVIDTGDYEQIGRKVMMMAFEYMERFALSTAANRIND